MLGKQKQGILSMVVGFFFPQWLILDIKQLFRNTVEINAEIKLMIIKWKPANNWIVFKHFDAFLLKTQTSSTEVKDGDGPASGTTTSLSILLCCVLSLMAWFWHGPSSILLPNVGTLNWYEIVTIPSRPFS